MSQIIVPVINALHKSTRNGFGASLRASGLIIGASFIPLTIHLCVFNINFKNYIAYCVAYCVAYPYHIVFFRFVSVNL